MNQFLDVAIAAAREAGAVLLAEHSRPQKITYKGDVDLVTETDKRSEAIVVGRLRREFPDQRIVAEEGSGNSRRKRPTTMASERLSVSVTRSTSPL